MAWTAYKTWTSTVLPASDLNTYVRDNGDILKTSVNDSGYLSVVDSTELTISSGAITVTQNFHTVDTESDAASDNLDTITAGTNVVAGHILFLRPANDGRTVDVRDNTVGSGNIYVGNSVSKTMNSDKDLITLLYDGTNWLMVSFESNGD